MKRVRVEGLKATDQALGELIRATSARTGKAALTRIAKQALEPFEEAWRARAPASIGGGFYHMKDTGGVGTKLTRRQRQQHKRESEVEQHAGPGPDPAAVQQEFGNSEHPAQPFVRPAWEATKGQALKIVSDELAGEIQTTAARAAKRAARKSRR